MIGLLLFTNGDAAKLKTTIDSIDQRVDGISGPMLIIDYSDDKDYEALLAESYSEFYEIRHARTGSRSRKECIAISESWTDLPVGCPYILHLNEGWAFTQDVNMFEIQRVLEDNDHLLQMSFADPKGAADSKEGLGHRWLESRTIFNPSPSMYHASVTVFGWPRVVGCKEVFSDLVFANNPDAKTAYWIS